MQKKDGKVNMKPCRLVKYGKETKKVWKRQDVHILVYLVLLYSHVTLYEPFEFVKAKYYLEKKGLGDYQ